LTIDGAEAYNVCSAALPAGPVRRPTFKQWVRLHRWTNTLAKREELVDQLMLGCGAPLELQSLPRSLVSTRH